MKGGPQPEHDQFYLSKLIHLVESITQYDSDVDVLGRSRAYGCGSGFGVFALSGHTRMKRQLAGFK